MINNTISIFGGSFDPVHQGHIELALMVQKMFHVNQMIFLPCGTPALKQPCHASGLHRVEMLKLAITNHPGCSIDERELIRKGPSYAIETLKSFRKQYGNKTSISFIIGEDAFASLMQWHEWKHLLDYCHIINSKRPNLSTPYASELKDYVEKHQSHDPHELQKLTHGKIFLMSFPNHPYSSTEIRQALKNKSIIYGLDEKVKQYIIHHQLYDF
jgi:nicotinate-nucleotide adenylyltransferase